MVPNEGTLNQEVFRSGVTRRYVASREIAVNVAKAFVKKFAGLAGYDCFAAAARNLVAYQSRAQDIVK